MTEARVSPLLPDELDERQRAFMAPFTDAKGRYPNLFGVLARNMSLLEAWAPYGLYTMRRSRLDPVLREVLVLRTAHNLACDYEWYQHRRIARSVGMTDEQMEAVRADPPTGEADYDLMVAVADDLAATARLSDSVWAAMTERFGLEATLDAVFTVGAYTALAMGINSCGIQVEGRST